MSMYIYIYVQICTHDSYIYICNYVRNIHSYFLGHRMDRSGHLEDLAVTRR